MVLCVHRLRQVAQGLHQAGAAAEEIRDPCRAAIGRGAGRCHLLEVMDGADRLASI